MFSLRYAATRAASAGARILQSDRRASNLDRRRSREAISPFTQATGAALALRRIEVAGKHVAQRLIIATLSSLLAIALSVSGCAGGTGGTKVVKDGFQGGELPPHATAKVKANYGKCNGGDPIACDWVGVWFLVGGGGQKNVNRAKAYFDFACKHGYRRGCVHMRQMEAGDHEM